MKITWVIAWVIGIAALMPGCSSYVNIPEQPMDVASNDPNDLRVRYVVYRALEEVVADQPIAHRYAIALTSGTSIESYEWVVSRLGEQALWPGDSKRTEMPVLEVIQVRIRNTIAQVDIVRPKERQGMDPETELLTVELESDGIADWTVLNVHVWQADVENLVRTKPTKKRKHRRYR